MKTAEDFAREVIAGYRPTIQFKAGVEELESYPEANMRARVLSAEIQRDNVVLLQVSYAEYEDYNAQFESANYYDSNMVPRLTARQRNFYKVVEDIYLHAPDGIEEFFSVVEDNGLFKEYREEVEKIPASRRQSYISWLEKELLAIRKAYDFEHPFS